MNTLSVIVARNTIYSQTFLTFYHPVDVLPVLARFKA